MTRLPLTADSDCPHCQGSGVVRVEVYVPVELLRVGDHVPRERRLCRCVRAAEATQKATPCRELVQAERDPTAASGDPALSSMERITRDPSRLGGVPAVRNVRILVITVLRHLQEGAEETLAAFPDLEPEDIVACLEFAARTIEQVYYPKEGDDVAP